MGILVCTVAFVLWMNNGHCLAELNSRIKETVSLRLGGAWAPIQASMIKSQAFFEVGGFNPKIIGTEDEDLCAGSLTMGNLLIHLMSSPVFSAARTGAHQPITCALLKIQNIPGICFWLLRVLSTV
jgi:hypothetical protein